MPSKRVRKWCFTENNPKVENYTNYIGFAKKYIFQLEEGENKTPHLQGVIELENAKTLKALSKLMPRARLSPCRDWKSSVLYCQKADGRLDGPWAKGIPIIRPLKTIQKFRPWQKLVVDLIRTEPDDRTINWYWESTGASGKTALAKYICANYNAIVLGGKGNDCLYAVADWKDPNDLIVIFDFSRQTEEYISYSAMEKIKDGCFFSGKYESKMCIMNSPHLICFANFKPNLLMLSQDRWNVVQIDYDTPPLEVEDVVKNIF